MVKVSTLIEGYQTFYQKYFIEKPEVYKKLVLEGQSPKTLVIACSDSRVDPSTILDTKPGDIFVLRNVANIVPPYEDEKNGYHSTSAAIEYAVECLKVENIIIFGHSDCGGIKTLMSDTENSHSFIDNWLYIAESSKQAALESNLNEKCMCEICEKESIKNSLKNLKTFPFVANNPNVETHGWYFCLETGLIEIITTE